MLEDEAGLEVTRMLDQHILHATQFEHADKQEVRGMRADVHACALGSRGTIHLHVYRVAGLLSPGMSRISSRLCCWVMH